ncbi:hypothetical protein O7626_03715 [Micromonospora sp. WMMD1102]|uniref:hypothetical protein n=1 Tax=Micromonospora sp. WMMD1102 TaxID=3016105 RepID=UPI0024152080|nr:hypothetical protein [Micromonospora sp. WMMD1102]MDG4785048.1 hypothetical protein [Micromonospora sp. WMMD1102]
MIRRIGVAVAALAVVQAAAVIAPASAYAAPMPLGQCTTRSGVILAVDFSRWGGPLLRSCGTTPTTGYQLLNQGGWKTAGTGHDGPAFICRIGYSGFRNGTQYPPPSEERCVLTPPASAYWSYWHADPGTNTWEYSQLGAMSYKPKPGSVDLWIFGGTDIGGTKGRPTFSPDSVRAHNTAPVPNPPPAPAPTTNRPAPGGNPPPAQAPAPPATADDATTVPVPTGPTGTLGGTPPATVWPSGAPSPTASNSGAGPTDTEGSGGPTVVDAVPTRAAPADRGSAGPLLITLGVLALLGSGGAVLGWRRRRTGSDAAPPVEPAP